MEDEATCTSDRGFENAGLWVALYVGLECSRGFVCTAMGLLHATTGWAARACDCDSLSERHAACLQVFGGRVRAHVLEEQRCAMGEHT